MFKKSARFYDAIYSNKDYESESKRVHALITERCPDARTLLDVACGTGSHMRYLKADYEVEGLDVNPDMVRIARQRHPDVAIHEADMVRFDLDKHFDAVICLFSSIAYVGTVNSLHRAVATMAAHVRPGGVLIVEPWVSPDVWESGRLIALFVDEPDIKIARIGTGWIEDRVSVVDLHYLVAEPGEGIECFREEHRMGLFGHDEYVCAFERADMHVAYDREGLTGRGLYVAVQPETKGTGGGT